MTSFWRAFIIKGNANNGRIPPSCHFSARMTLFPVIAFINEEATGCINEEAIGAIIGGRNPPSCFFYFMFYYFTSTIN